MSQLLEAENRPVLTQFEFFRLVWKTYQDNQKERLYLRSQTPDVSDFSRIRLNLKSSRVISSDRDYGRRVIRVLTVTDLPAEDIICIVDPTCYVSHISAMQRWGFTDRNPSKLFLTRANKPTEQTAGKDTIDPVAAANQFNPFPSRIAEHPTTVRKREIHIQETKSPGESLKERSSYVNISTVGQTFLDMLQKPELCGGMAHVIDVWQEHAANYFSEIVDVIDRASSNLVKSRAGYILEAQLGLRHDKFENWKALGQRGGSRKLDPTKPFAPTFSETWMISINV